MENSNITKYLEIVEKIKNKIYCSIYQPNDMLPSEKSLSIEYNVSRKTLRRAINYLIEDGFLYTVPGKGIFVDIESKNLYRVDLGINNLLKNGYDQVNLYSANIVIPDVYHVYRLGIAPEEKVICMRWILYRKGKIIAYDIRNIPYLQGILIDESNLGYKTLKDILAVKFPHNEIIEKGIISVTAAKPEIKEIMYSEDKLVVTADKILIDKSLNPLGWNQIYIRPDEFEFEGESV